ncbi:MAG TPA: rhodanese-like domain-containing protein, partial [Acidimicrobiia bacterium]|nr:rhodanese-like domain-containing protein [Acidimicrobiia bacterium]
VVRNPEAGTETFRAVQVDEFAEAALSGAQVLDVRAPSEWDTDVIEGSILSYLPDLAEKTPDGLSRDEPVWVACAGGYRASIAAGILASRGFEPVVLIDGGATDVMCRTSNES